MIAISLIGPDFTRWQELLDLVLSSFAYMDGVIAPPSSASALTPESLKQKAMDEKAFVATENGLLLGCIFCRVEPPDSLYIGKLAVQPQAQGKGIGKRLLAEAERLARDADLRQLRLETRIELRDNHKTFSAWGFRKSADGRHEGFDRTTFIEMRKVL